MPRWVTWHKSLMAVLFRTKEAMKLPFKYRMLSTSGIISAVFVLAVIVCAYAIYSHSKREAETKVTGKSEYAFSGSKSQYIYGYATAPVSLQQALVNQYYDQARVNCIAANESVSQNVQSDQVLYIDKITGNFALVKFCGSGGDTIFDYMAGKWTIIGNEADYPDCSLVNQYKISKQIVPQCYTDSTGTLTNVTYP